MWKRVLSPWCLCALFAMQAHATTSSSIYSLSADPNTFVPDQFSSVNPALQTVSNIATLGDGSLGFNGGITQGIGGLYAIGNDSNGAGSFYSVSLDGAISLIGTAGGLGDGFFGGLAFDSANGTFYAAVNDNSGNSSLYSITAGGVATNLSKALGTGFSGLAYDSNNGLFYGIGNDNSGNSTLYDFSLNGTIDTVASIGMGFGGLTYDPQVDAFWAIQGVNNAGSQLFQLSPAGAESSSFMTLGDGFTELTTLTPEPSSFTDLAVVLLIVGLGRLRWSRSRD